MIRAMLNSRARLLRNFANAPDVPLLFSARFEFRGQSKPVCGGQRQHDGKQQEFDDQQVGRKALCGASARFADQPASSYLPSPEPKTSVTDNCSRHRKTFEQSVGQP